MKIKTFPNTVHVRIERPGGNEDDFLIVGRNLEDALGDEWDADIAVYKFETVLHAETKVVTRRVKSRKA